jgi:PAS domain S-box-containing protein
VLKPFKLQAVLPTLSRAIEVRRLRLENVQLRGTVAIYELSMAIAFTLDEGTILSKVADAALQQCQADEVSVMLPTPRGDELYVAVVRGDRPRPILGERMPISRGVAGWVARQRQPVTLQGEVVDPRFAPINPRCDIRSAISMPMLVGGKLVGVLNVNATDRRRGFRLGQVKALNILASIAGAALETARLYAEMREAEEKYRSLFENAVEGIFQTTPEGQFVAANPALARIYGYDSPHELIAAVKDISRQVYVDPNRRAEFMRLLHEGASVFTFESQVYRRDGRVIWISESAHALYDTQGKLLGYEGMVVDITDRKRAEEEIRNLAKFPAENPAPILRLTHGGLILYANEASQALLQEWDCQVGCQAPSLWRQRVNEVLASGAKKAFDMECGERIYGFVLAPVPEAGYVNLYGLDITDRKRAEEALRTRTGQLEAVRAVTEEIIRELDLTTLLSVIIQRAAGLVGAVSGLVSLWDEATKVLIPRAWYGFGEWMSGVRFHPGEGVTGNVAQQREGMIVSDYRTSPYAHPLFVERTGITATVAEPLLYRDRLIGVITIDNQGIGRPFTEEDREILALFAAQAAIAIENARLYEQVKQHSIALEERIRERTRELAAANQQLQEASTHKSEFLANMSHELRTPLNSILGFSQLLLEQTASLLSEKQSRHLTHIHNSGQHLLQLINDILDISKVEAGALTLQPGPLPVASTLEDILVIARGLANKKGQTVEAAIEPDLPQLHADPVRFKQILFNLLSNAVKFTPEQGRITVRAYAQGGAGDQENGRMGEWESGRTGDGENGGMGEVSPTLPLSHSPTQLVIEVKDTGAGIRAEDLPRLFREFVQLETTQAQRHEGAGLGLALTKKLVEVHGGRIWANSEGEGQGSTFTVLLPFVGPA